MSSGESDAFKPNMRLQGLAAESVPYPHETKGYWYTRYYKLASALLNFHRNDKPSHFVCGKVEWEQRCEVCAMLTGYEFQKA